LSQRGALVPAKPLRHAPLVFSAQVLDGVQLVAHLANGLLVEAERRLRFWPLLREDLIAHVNMPVAMPTLYMASLIARSMAGTASSLRWRATRRLGGC
jgi:hypothetical protein